MAYLSIENLSFKYALASHHSLSNINLEINRGDFVLIAGASGSGKTTLIKQLKKELQPAGDLTGNIIHNGVNLKDLSMKDTTSQFGYVMQNPDNQIISDKVWHELVFALENNGYDQKTMEIKVAEMANFFGIQEMYNHNTYDLSGGQKQLLNLASIMVLQPSVLILDEPTSQLDPIARNQFIDILKKINDEFNTTIIMVEHTLDYIFNLVDRVVIMDQTKIDYQGSPQDVINNLNQVNPRFVKSLPQYLQLASKLAFKDILSIKSLKEALQENVTKLQVTYSDSQVNEDVVLSIEELYFKYHKKDKDILTDINLSFQRNSIHTIMGGNGVGKSTLIKNILGILKPYHGKIIYQNKNILKDKTFIKDFAYLPQDPTLLFNQEKVNDEIAEINSPLKEDLIKKLDLQDILKMHPYDLSGGQQQRLALCKILLNQPKVIILDEPTKGLDSYAKDVLVDILNELKKECCIIIISHDIEFAIKCSDYCMMLFNRQIIGYQNTRAFFNNNEFYTSVIAKVSKNIFEKEALLVEDINYVK